MLSFEALSATLDYTKVDHCGPENSQSPELLLDDTATMLATRVLVQCEPIELALGLLSAPSRKDDSAMGGDTMSHCSRGRGHHGAGRHGPVPRRARPVLNFSEEPATGVVSEINAQRPAGSIDPLAPPPSTSASAAATAMPAEMISGPTTPMPAGLTASPASPPRRWAEPNRADNTLWATRARAPPWSPLFRRL